MTANDEAQDYEILETARLDEKQRSRLIQILVDSFKDEPFLSGVEPDGARRNMVAEYQFRKRLDLFLLYSYALVQKDNGLVVGHAALSPACSPGMSPSVYTQLKSGILLAPWNAVRRFRIGVAYFKKSAEDLDSYTLEAVAIDKAFRGKGLGKLLMAKVLSPLVGSGNRVFMATQVESNVRFYESLGFKVSRHGIIDIEGSQFPNWFMAKIC